MKNRIILTVVCLLLFSGFVWALDNSAGFRIPNPGGRPIRVIVQVSVPEDMQLVRKDGSIVKDEICVGEDFALQDQTDTGDYWQDGGYEGDPPIHWTTDAKNVALSMNDPSKRDSNEYRELVATQTYPVNLGVGGVCLRGLNLTLGENTLLPVGSLRSIQGGLACTLKKKDAVVSGAQRSENYYMAEIKGEINFKAETDIECFYYYTTERDDVMGAAPPFAMGLCGESMPLQPIEQSGLINATGDTSNFKVGTIEFSKKIKVVDPAKQNVDITVIGGDNLKSREDNVLKVIVRNKGQVDVNIKDIESAASKYRFIACEATLVAPGEEKECLISVTPGPGESSGIRLNYEYKACGKVGTDVAYEAGANFKKIAPSQSAQVYRIDVHGGCENTYYGCLTPDKDGKFYAGGKCYNTQDKYYSSVTERFVLRFNLPSDLLGKTIKGAKLKTFISDVDRAQDVRIYSGANTWAEASCSAGGDICAKPYCEACARIFDLAGEQVASQNIQTAGVVSFDVTEAVRKAYGSGTTTLSLQMRGLEDLWNSDGNNACSRKDDWTTYDIRFFGKGASQPYLEIGYE